MIFNSKEYFAEWDGASLVAVDVETRGTDPTTGELLGVSLAYRAVNGAVNSTYVALAEWKNDAFQYYPNYEQLRQALSSIVQACGANFIYDQKWIGYYLGIKVPFTFDTQVGWHHSDNAYTQRSYGLKALQKALLGWEDDNAGELAANVKAKGGSLKNGDHYLADLSVLAKYARLDAEATLLGSEKLIPFFDRHDYHGFLYRTFRYRALLDEATTEGLTVDVERLDLWIEASKQQRQSLLHEFITLCAGQIMNMEARWVEEKCINYSYPATALAYKADPSRHKRFNLNSNGHLAELFYDALGEFCAEKTKGGDRAVHKIALRGMKHPAAKVLLRFNELQKSLEYAESYRDALGRLSKLHPRYNVTGTVSGRLSCFAPNVQQMPLGEAELMRCFTVPKGRVGIGADLTSVEPFFTAIYSEDPTLLKVYRDGLGDIYLDLCLTLFPDNEALRQQYDPSAPPSEAVKSVFKLIRAIAKLVHLACQYGAGSKKVALILTQNGFPTSEDEGRRLHKLYWQRFKKVKDLEAGLYEIYRADGRVVNPFGRIIQLPDFWCKDLLNRFIQSTGHDALMEWVLRFKTICAARELNVGHVIPDWHDATYWHCAPEDADEIEQALQDALTEVNAMPEMAYPLKASFKRFNSLAEIK